MYLVLGLCSFLKSFDWDLENYTKIFEDPPPVFQATDEWHEAIPLLRIHKSAVTLELDCYLTLSAGFMRTGTLFL